MGSSQGGFVYMFSNYTPVQNMIFVSDEEARNYYLPPNSKVLLMSKDKPVFYVKTTDAIGQPNIDTYSFKKEEPQPTPTQQPAPTPANVVTKEDLDAFKAEILTLLAPKSQEEVNPNV